MARRSESGGIDEHMQRASRQTVVRTTILPNGQKHDEEVDLLTDFSWRNFFSTINFAKIMQKLSKHRSHRIRMLVQYKSSVSRLHACSRVHARAALCRQSGRILTRSGVFVTSSGDNRRS